MFCDTLYCRIPSTRWREGECTPTQPLSLGLVNFGREGKEETEEKRNSGLWVLSTGDLAYVHETWHSGLGCACVERRVGLWLGLGSRLRED